MTKDRRKTKTSGLGRTFFPRRVNQGPRRLKGNSQYHTDCQYHLNQWVCHTSQECSKNPANADSSTPSKGEKPNSRRLKAAKLAAALLEDEGDESGEESQGDDP
jgi:hypothetical protein